VYNYLSPFTVIFSLMQYNVNHIEINHTIALNDILHMCILIVSCIIIIIIIIIITL